MSRSGIGGEVDRRRLHARLGAAVAALGAPPPTPTVVVDLDANAGCGCRRPRVGPGAVALQVGDLAWFRQPKTGEHAEHVGQVHLLSGARVTRLVPSYREAGNTW